MSISKKLAAVVSAAAVVASMFAAAPANAETTSAFINRTISSMVDRPIDEVTHTVKFYAGEEINLYMNSSIKSDVLSTNAPANTEVVVDGGYSLVSGTLSAGGGKSVYLSGQMGSTSFNEMTLPSATELKITKTFASAITSLNVNINVNATAATDVVLAFNPVIKLGTHVVTEADYTWGNTESASRSGGSYNPESNGRVRVGRAEDARMNFYADTACVKTTGLVAGDVLVASMTVSDGASNVGESSPYWQIKNAEGMSNGPGTEGETFTFSSVPAGSTLSVYNNVSISTPVAGKTYTVGEVKIVKQGTTENLMSSCATSGVTATLAVVGSKVTATLDTTADGGMMGSKFDSYTCALYASTDANHATVVKSSRGYRTMGTPGAAMTTSCVFNSVPAGTYVVGLRGGGWKGLSEEVYVATTATVTGSVTPAKKTPRVPTIATKVKAGKTFAIALHATKGTAKTAANLDGLVTKVVLASSSKGYCSITPVIKSKKIAGYTVKGLKVNATKCAVTITITGNTLFNTLTKTVKVNVTK